MRIGRQWLKAGRRVSAWCLAGAVLCSAGCLTPRSGSVSRTRVLQPDQDDGLGGSFIGSQDIRNIAVEMTAALLSTPEIGGKEGVTRIAVSPIRNSTRYMFDKDIFMKRLRIELQRHSEGKVRFFSQGVGQGTRSEIIRDQDEAMWEQLLDQTAAALVSSPTVKGAKGTSRLAVIPVRNTNLVGLNADSFTALLRAKVSEQGAGKLVFLSREKNGKVIEEILDEKDAKDQGLVAGGKAKQLYGVDCFLGGEFVGKSLTGDTRNVTKYLLVKLIDAETGAVPFEKLVRVQRKITSGVASADYLLTGDISALSKAASGGDRSDYVIMSFQLVDPASNEVLWEDAYETKKASRVSVIYK